jgi:hypothetical protein
MVAGIVVPVLLGGVIAVLPGGQLTAGELSAGAGIFWGLLLLYMILPKYYLCKKCGHRFLPRQALNAQR